MGTCRKVWCYKVYFNFHCYGANTIEFVKWTIFKNLTGTYFLCNAPCVIKNKNTLKPNIEAVTVTLCEKYQKVYYPFQNVCIDKMVIPYKDRWKYRQYNPNKSSKYHMKMCSLCDSITSYCYNTVTDMGTKTSDSDLEFFWTIGKNIWTYNEATAPRPTYFFLTGLTLHARLV